MIQVLNVHCLGWRHKYVSLLGILYQFHINHYVICQLIKAINDFQRYSVTINNHHITNKKRWQTKKQHVVFGDPFQRRSHAEQIAQKHVFILHLLHRF